MSFFFWSRHPKVIREYKPDHTKHTFTIAKNITELVLLHFCSNTCRLLEIVPKKKNDFVINKNLVFLFVELCIRVTFPAKNWCGSFIGNDILLSKVKDGSHETQVSYCSRQKIHCFHHALNKLKRQLTL